MLKKLCQVTATPLYGGASENWEYPHGDPWDRQKRKILIMFRLWLKWVSMNLKRTSMTFKIKLNDNLSFATTFSLYAKLFFVSVFGSIGLDNLYVSN